MQSRTAALIASLVIVAPLTLSTSLDCASTIAWRNFRECIVSQIRRFVVFGDGDIGNLFR